MESPLKCVDKKNLKIFKLATRASISSDKRASPGTISTQAGASLR
jgi:hypothetical protein